MLHTSLVCFHFRRSTTGKRSREEREDDRGLSDEIADMNGPALG
jgi:hypothetical protein